MQNPLTVLKSLKAKGILGMNQRNAEFIQLYNPRKNFPLVDNKILTKALAQKVGIGVPELYCVVEIEHQIAQIHEVLKQHTSFVVKPAHGSGGTGILVIVGRRGSNYLKSDGTILTPDDLSFHISNTLSGLYSLGGAPDAAMIEYRVEFDPLFQEVSYQGVPDIRVIVFQGYPVMAMVRLPTRQSSGKANLHQGAIGVGVDLQTGFTRMGVQHNQLATLHPDTGSPVEGITIPHWENLLLFCSRCYELTGLGYIGVDIVLDKNKGPMMLEINARPGLAIQIANQKGLLPRLSCIKQEAGIKRTPEERVGLVLKNAVFA